MRRWDGYVTAVLHECTGTLGKAEEETAREPVGWYKGSREARAESLAAGKGPTVSLCPACLPMALGGPQQDR